MFYVCCNFVIQCYKSKGNTSDTYFPRERFMEVLPVNYPRVLLSSSHVSPPYNSLLFEQMEMGNSTSMLL